jgi:NhaA family Na+:H+ antiporter
MESRMQTSNRSFVARFMQHEASGGLVLMAMAMLGLVAANSSVSQTYFGLLQAHVGGLSVLEWINDALMAVFFLLVGLEIKREIVSGRLATWSQRALPGLAALGGMAAPAIVFVAFNSSSPETLRGWAIPSATDIAFTLGVLSLLGSRVPFSLKVFLMALAIIDDLGAVVIIALFYAAEIDPMALGCAGAVAGMLVCMNRFEVRDVVPYLALGTVLWVLVFMSGIHATLAGVVLAFTIPMSIDETTGDSPLIRIETAIHPHVAYLIVPLFGFANAGVSFAGFTPAAIFDPVPLGVAAGLFLGKQAGVLGISMVAIRMGLSKLPEGATLRQFYGVAILCGIGFTMSIFIGLLAYPASSVLQGEVKIGVFLGSILSGIAGAAVLIAAPASRIAYDDAGATTGPGAGSAA